MGKTRLVKLRYTRRAIAALSLILDYIGAQSPQGARRVHARIQITIELLLLHPNIDTRTGDPTIRRVTASLTPNLISYEATEAEIIIHAVRHAARDPAEMSGTAGESGETFTR